MYSKMCDLLYGGKRFEFTDKKRRYAVDVKQWKGNTWVHMHGQKGKICSFPGDVFLDIVKCGSMVETVDDMLLANTPMMMYEQQQQTQQQSQ